MSVRFSVSGFIKPEEAEAIKIGLKEAIRQIEIGQEIHLNYNLPDVPSAGLINLAFRNSYKAYMEGVNSGQSNQEGESVRGPGGDNNQGG